MCPYLLLSLVAPSRCLRGSKEGMRTSRKQESCREPEHVPGGSGPWAAVLKDEEEYARSVGW